MNLHVVFFFTNAKCDNLNKSYQNIFLNVLKDEASQIWNIIRYALMCIYIELKLC